MKPIPVIVVVFNRPEYSQACLDSLYEAEPGVPIFPVIVDNGSRRRTKSMLNEWAGRYEALPETTKQVIQKPTIRRLERNSGFAAGLNVGVKVALEAEAEYISVLHNDTIPFAGWASGLHSCLTQDDDEIVVAMPCTNYANEQGMCIKKYRERFQEVKPDNKVRILPEEIEAILEHTYPDGADKLLEDISTFEPEFSYSPELASFCMMFRANLAKEYPLFDEDFFPRGGEDKFWFLPMERDGLVCQIANRVFVHHFGNITSDGPGFCFPESAKVNQERFKEKVRELDKRGPDGFAYNEGETECETGQNHKSEEES